ncbi:MAG: ABC transporter permease [Clostridia bacterium]|nr:ABC transporter permease [Clostridia bacterium]
MDSKPKCKGKFAAVVILSGLLLSAYALWEIAQVPGLLQYVVQADTEISSDAPSMLRRRIDMLEEAAPALEQVVAAYTLTGSAPQVALSAEQTGAVAGLRAVGRDHFVVYPALLLSGRFPHPEELELGERVMLLDEQLALALFRMAEVIDREVELQGEPYRVIGVLRRQRRVGDDADRYATIPLAAAARAGIQLETLRLSAAPVPRGGAKIVFAEAAERWNPGGNAYDLRRERVGANIWARFLACGIGFAALGWLIAKYAQSIGALQARMREKLAHQYITRLLPYLLFHILLRVIALAALAGLAAALANLLLEPIQAFPEFVPDILVEPNAIADTFWNLRRAESSAVVIRTPQVVRLLYFGQLCNIAAILTLAGGCLLLRRRRRR